MFWPIRNTADGAQQRSAALARCSAFRCCAKEAPIGVIALQRKTVRPFTDKQIELVTTFADQAVIAIENVRLFDEVQARTRELTEALEQQTATSEVLQVITSSPGELEPVFQAMLANATRICEAKFGTLWLREGDAFRAGRVAQRAAGLCRVRAGASRVSGRSRTSPSGASPRRSRWSRSPTFTTDMPTLERDPTRSLRVELGGARTVSWSRCSRTTS